MKTYTVTVRPNSDAFAAIRRFDPEAAIELEVTSDTTETYTIASEYDLFSLLDDAPGVEVWDEIIDTDLSDSDFPPDDPEPFNAPAKFQDWDCWQHPSLGWQESKRLPKSIEKISDYALTKLIDFSTTSEVAKAEWRRRYPNGGASRTGTKIWARGYDTKASQ